ncbi:MAG: hypothetical protein EVA72_06850 [Limisphaerales bacterium]|nr:MAG: hypothetical protein EVA72_06850 [Limisphaerales bacterium]
MKYNLQLFSTVFISLVFATAIWISNNRLGLQLRDQVLRNRAEVLQAITLVHQESVIEAYGDLSIDNAADQLIIMEEISELSGANGFRLYTEDGNYIYSFPETIREGFLNSKQIINLKSLTPYSELYEKVNIEDWILTPDFEKTNEDISILVITLPLSAADDKKLHGIVQLILDGDNVRNDIYELNNRIKSQSLFIFFAGLALIIIVQMVSYRLLSLINKRLIKRTEALNNANQALALSDKVSAVGSISSHLVHGLRNPLSAVKAHLKNLPAETESSEAILATERMGKMIEDVVMTLRENESEISYQISITELLYVLSDRLANIAEVNNVKLVFESNDNLQLDNRKAGLILLIMENIICNAIEACGSNGEIFIRSHGAGVLRISDNGPGIPNNLKEKLFKAGNSTKEQGSGLGLAISKKLSISIGAELILFETGTNGTTFELRL